MGRGKSPGGEFKQIESFENPENNHSLDSKIEQREIMDLAIATAKKKVNEVGGVRANPDLLLHGAYKRMEVKDNKDIDKKAFDYTFLENVLRAGLVTPDFLDRARK